MFLLGLTVWVQTVCFRLSTGNTSGQRVRLWKFFFINIGILAIWDTCENLKYFEGYSDTSEGIQGPGSEVILSNLKWVNFGDICPFLFGDIYGILFKINKQTWDTWAPLSRAQELMGSHNIFDIIYSKYHIQSLE